MSEADEMERRLPDDLIERIRRRAADVATRTDASPTSRGQTVEVGGFAVRGVSLDDLLTGATTQPSDGRDELPGPATDEEFLRAEQRLGFSIPEPLKQLYRTIADGGFGPGDGLMSVSELTATYQGVTQSSPSVSGQSWPVQMLPFTRTAPGHDCLDRDTGAVVVWDEEVLADGESDEIWAKSFRVASPSLADWLEQWVSSASPEQQMRTSMEATMQNGLRESLNYWRSMSVAERATYGLPEEGWEEELFGHLGIDLSKL